VGGDETAAAVGRLWREALGPAADGDRTFSDLGGTSRRAMTLLRQVRVTLGRDVAMEDFLADPTLPGLTAAARRAARTDDAPPVVQLAPGEPDLPPLFFVHDAWGDVDVYWPAAQLLTGTGPVHGIRASLNHPDGTPIPIDELAIAGVAAVQRVAPRGPLRLAGHSFGGLVAFEMARRLTAVGREVDFLGLFDVLPPTASLRPAQRMVSAVVNRLALVLPGLADQPLREVLAARIRPASASADSRLLRQSNRVFNAYCPEPYAGPVTYFRARRRIPVAQNALRSWRRIAPRLTVIDVPGSHHDVLGQANVVESAAAMSQALAGAAGPP
jgi:acetoacetyl-CoA synthetase